MGRLAHGPTVGRIVTSALSPETYSSYGTGWRHWVAFCDERDLAPLEATEYDACDFLVYLANRGTVQIRTCTPYLVTRKLYSVYVPNERSVATGLMSNITNFPQYPERVGALVRFGPRVRARALASRGGMPQRAWPSSLVRMDNRRKCVAMRVARGEASDW